MSNISVAELEMILADWTPEEGGHSHFFEKDLLPEDYFREDYDDPVRNFIHESLVKFGSIEDVLSMFAFH